MTRRFTTVTFVLSVVVAVWWLTDSSVRSGRVSAGAPVLTPVPVKAPVKEASDEILVSPRLLTNTPKKWSRAEAAKYLTAYFTREQLTRELALEQSRYGPQYWDSEMGVAALRELQARREETTKRLSTEMNDILTAMCPGEAGERLTLKPFFSLDQAGPNLGFLSPASREALTEAILSFAQDEPIDAGKLQEAASKVLAGDELEQYNQWNAPAAAALRNRLVGFEADETEFKAIQHWQRELGLERDPAITRTELARQIGVDRLAQFERLEEPVMRTAVQDLHRLGLPLDQAAWLSDFRTRAVAHIQKLWGDAALTDTQREALVKQVQSAYRVELTAQLGMSDSALNEADLLP